VSLEVTSKSSDLQSRIEGGKVF